jgi:hypothetical protein
MNLCGDPTCTGYGCTSEALDAWEERQQQAARDVVRSFLSDPRDRLSVVEQQEEEADLGAFDSDGAA